jgi:hypothetical protein
MRCLVRTLVTAALAVALLSAVALAARSIDGTRSLTASRAGGGTIGVGGIPPALRTPVP